jgi:hypothetical protein
MLDQSQIEHNCAYRGHHDGEYANSPESGASVTATASSLHRHLKVRWCLATSRLASPRPLISYAIVNSTRNANVPTAPHTRSARTYQKAMPQPTRPYWARVIEITVWVTIQLTWRLCRNAFGEKQSKFCFFLFFMC